MTDSKKLNELEKQKINLETAKIAWVDLQRYFAAGRLVLVAKELDLVDVAFQFSIDNTKDIDTWKKQSKLDFVSDQQARDWLQKNVTLWAVVVKPWVLVQESLKIKKEHPDIFPNAPKTCS